jgi:integrase
MFFTLLAISEYVFLNSRTGARLKSVDKAFQKTRTSAGLDGSGIVIHSLRHQGASMALASGADLTVVRDLLGHANITTSEKYLHSLGDRLRSGTRGIRTICRKLWRKKLLESPSPTGCIGNRYGWFLTPHTSSRIPL